LPEIDSNTEDTGCSNDTGIMIICFIEPENDAVDDKNEERLQNLSDKKDWATWGRDNHGSFSIA
jgi:hypothetical protein